MQIKKILVPLDFSKTSLKALDHAAYLAKMYKAELTLLHAAEGFSVTAATGYYVPPSYELEHNKNVINQSKTHLTDISERLKQKGVTKINTIAIISKPSKEIVFVAKKIKADMIVMGTHGVSGFREFFAGSNTFKIIRNAKCPVLSIQQTSKNPGFTNILLPFRDKQHGREHVDYAIQLAKKYGATLNVLGVDTEGTPVHKNKIILESEQIKKFAGEAGVPCKTKVISNAFIATAILKQAQAISADLIITVSDLDRMGIDEYFTGPFSQQLVNHSSIPVLSIKPSFNTDSIDLRFY